MARWTGPQGLLSLQIALYLSLIFVRGSEDADEAYRSGRSLVLEYFLPIKAGVGAEVPPRREKRDVEGSGEDEGVFGGVNGKEDGGGGNVTESGLGGLSRSGGSSESGVLSGEGSGEVEEEEESWEVGSSEGTGSAVPLIAESEVFTTTGLDEVTESRSEVISEETSTNMVFDRSEDFDDVSTEESTTVAAEPTPAVILETTTTGGEEEVETTEGSTTQVPGEKQDEEATRVLEESTTVKVSTAAFATEPTTGSPAEATTVIVLPEDAEAKSLSATEAVERAEETKELTTVAVTEAMPSEGATEEGAKAVIIGRIVPGVSEEGTEAPEGSLLPKLLTTMGAPVEAPETTPQPVVEEVFKESRIDKKVEAMPGNILQKENLSLAADPLLITNTRLMDSEETVQLSSSEPKRLGAYIVIGLILLSFSSLVGYITFRKRMNRKRQEFESNQESNDTEKALLSLSDYKDSSELEENHLKNNEITPIVVKSNSQINKFEKNTNFSSPKNLNTTANEKNIEKDNVLKSTAENLTQVIIEGSPKDVEEDKNVPNMEKLIVKTRIDQDSIPKKPIIINRSSTGYMPIPQDNP